MFQRHLIVFPINCYQSQLIYSLISRLVKVSPLVNLISKSVVIEKDSDSDSLEPPINRIKLLYLISSSSRTYDLGQLLVASYI